jgi:thiol-disulfide isomerase/thioredoxin
VTLRLALPWIFLAAALTAGGNLIDEVRAAADSRDFSLAEREIQAYRAARGVTPEMLDALSWLARGALDARQYDGAERYAAETRRLGRNHLPPLALGAAIEVHAQVLAARGRRPEALAFLRNELAAYGHSPIADRIQKNINLLTLEGKPAPPLDVSHWLGPKPRPLAALRGRPVLLFFWSHWCADCKAEVPILAALMSEFGPRGLRLVGPTQRYGYTADGDAGPAREAAYIDQIRKQFYAALPMPVPLSKLNFRRYGCSTTPTLVLLDGAGIVRLYHPGAMTYDALAQSVRSVLAPDPSKHTSRSSRASE